MSFCAMKRNKLGRKEKREEINFFIIIYYS